MDRKGIVLALSFVFTLGVFAPAGFAAPKASLKMLTKAASPDTPNSREAEFIRLINIDRSKRGLGALALDPVLMDTARLHSRDMAERDYFSHHSPAPAPRTPTLRYVEDLKNIGGVQPESMLVGENIYYCSVYTKDFDVKYSHKALMDSPGHRANILEPRYQKVGVGVYIDPIGQFYVTEMFLRDTPVGS
jgi:uncharacterized protein YkwD